MQKLLASSLILVAVCLCIVLIPQANALPVSYNQTALNFGFTSVPRNSSSYDVFPLIPDNWLWEKFDNNTVDSSPLSVSGTVTYNTNAKAVYHFENVITDSSSNARTLTKAAGTQTFVGGHEGQGLSFDGSTYYTGSDTGLPSGNNPVSISLWFKPTSLGSNQALISYGTTNTNQLFGLRFNSGNTVDLLTNNYDLVVSNTVLSLNNWYHIVGTWDGTTAKIYVNGILDNTATPAILNITLSGALGLDVGAFSGGVQKMNGVEDEDRVYTGTLSQAQVSALYMVGHYAQSHTFDGGEYVTTNLDFSNNPFTFSFWFNFPDNTAGTFNDNKGVLGNDIYGIRTAPVAENKNFLEMFLKENDGSVEPRVTAGFTPGQYNYAAFTWDGTTLKMYLNNILVSSQTRNLPTASSSTNINIGGANNPGACCVIGQIDNLKVYPYALSSSQITSDYNSISPISSGKQFMSWYNGISGSSTLTKKIGSGQSSLTLACSPTLGGASQFLISNNLGIDYLCPGNPAPFYSNNIISNTNSIIWHSPTAAGSYTLLTPFISKSKLMTFSIDDGGSTFITTSSGNTSSLGNPSGETMSNQRVNMNLGMFKYHYNGTALVASSGTDCDLLYLPTNTTKAIDSIVCDRSVPANTIRYWQGMNIQGSAIYYTNSTFPFLTSIDNNSYKKLLSLPCIILVNESPCETFIMTDFTNTDYLVVLTSTHVYFKNAQQANNILLNHNFALQSYDVITKSTTSAYEIPNNPLLQAMTIYGFNLNQTINKFGLFTIPSGDTIRTTTVTPSIRTIDPRWTNDATDIPIITSTSSLFPIYLTASNAPSFSAIKVTSAQQIINNQEAVWAVAQLDSTRSVEFDLPPGVCANIYIADISVSPTIWNFEGIICATGVNQKTIAYTNTVPFTFYNLKYGVTDSYVPANNGLQTTFRTQVAPTTYTVIVKNSTGIVAINQTFTVPANQTIDTRTFNVSSVSKPAALTVMVSGNQVYSSYLGSPLSLANVSAFFHQYFSYQGFDLLSFIPIIFASMFTRNTVGVGMALTVVCIATLSWLSVVVVPDNIVYLGIFVACIGIVGYRSIYG